MKGPSVLRALASIPLWQSAVEETSAAAAKLGLNAARTAPPGAATTALAETLNPDPRTLGTAPAALSALPAPAQEAVDKARRCSELALHLAWAKLQGDTHAIQQIQNDADFGTCDPLWAETVERYLLYFSKDKGSIPYRSGGDYLLDEIPAQATIAIIGDWGTGTDAARSLLAQVAGKKPDVVFHLGDIYYSGTPTECQQRFLDICRHVLDGKTRLYSLSGNHDMYSGGVGYYALVDQLEQQASYFCVRNANWQFLAMDTGYNDFNPFTVNKNVTSLTDTEAQWHLDKIAQAGARQTVLLSHHPLFSAFDAIGGNPVNGKLLDTFKDVLGGVAIWLWGHEHRLGIYAPHLGLQRGRCVGCSAIPVFTAEDKYEPQFDVPLLQDASGNPIRLGDDGTVYRHAYAIMTLDGPSAQVAYYQDNDAVNPLFTEALTARS